jgi:F0F1-type ATP synthase epsilon subunit
MSQRGDHRPKGQEDTVNLERAQQRYEKAQDKVPTARTDSERRRFEREARDRLNELQRAEEKAGYVSGRR